VLREPFSLESLDGTRLEAEIVSPDEPWAAAVLTHPHPRHGGNMRSMVPGELTRILPDAGIAVLRFNFRGMGVSEGQFENGVGERLDAIAAVSALHDVVEGVPLFLCGSSFGADTALCVDDERISAWIACAPPLRDERFDQMQSVGHDERPKLLVVPERDQYRDPEGVNFLTGAWKSTDVVVVKGSDHFFVGNLEKVGQICLHYMQKFRN
jgi:uncharacterized protein